MILEARCITMNAPRIQLWSCPTRKKTLTKELFLVMLGNYIIQRCQGGKHCVVQQKSTLQNADILFNIPWPCFFMYVVSNKEILLSCMNSEGLLRRFSTLQGAFFTVILSFYKTLSCFCVWFLVWLTNMSLSHKRSYLVGLAWERRIESSIAFLKLAFYV